MTLREVAQQLGKSESTIYKNFKRTQETLKKKGIILTKWGVDDYEIEYEEQEDMDGHRCSSHRSPRHLDVFRWQERRKGRAS